MPVPVSGDQELSLPSTAGGEYRTVPGVEGSEPGCSAGLTGAARGLSALRFLQSTSLFHWPESSVSAIAE